MPLSASPRIAAAVRALPVKSGMRVLEIGCGPGAAARELLRIHPSVFVLGIDRSAAAVRQAIAGSEAEMAKGALAFRCVAAEEFQLEKGERPFDLAFALRVGALDGRHPRAGAAALRRIAAAMSDQGSLFIDGGTPLVEVALDATL